MAVVALVALVALAMLAAASPALARAKYHHTIAHAMGLVPAHGKSGRFFDPAVSSQVPVVYHSGPVMGPGPVTVHTIFWAPAGYHFTGSPSPGVLGYEGLIKQFMTDAAASSGSSSNLFSTLKQYGDSAGSGQYSIRYSAAADSIDDTDPYPPNAQQCASPAGTRTCLTDAEVSREIDHIIQATDPSGRGLHDLWEVFLPPDVDECIVAGSCGTNYFAAYHSLADWGHGTFIYALMVDPLVEAPPVAGSDPEGNPDAESSIDSAAHEMVEAISDPEGSGWMDPDGFEVADICETTYGAPLGYAPNGSPYNQLVGGHRYFIQDMWSNRPIGCVQSSATTADGLPLPTISLTQFSSRVSGSIGKAVGDVAVHVVVERAFALVAQADTRTRPNGTWGPVVLLGPHGERHAVGDDRDVIGVSYGRGGPEPDLILTGSGGDPFAESGWTGWLDLDTGAIALRDSVLVGPCFQTGVSSVLLNGRVVASPTPECNTQTDIATVRTPRLTGSSRIQVSDIDNRAPSQLSAFGALVRLTVPVGEPGSGSSAIGIPICDAQLRLQIAVCSGLVPHQRYRLTSSRGGRVRRARASWFGVARFRTLPIRGGDVLSLRNAPGRLITRLHVAHLRVELRGRQLTVSGGRCQPGDYWGLPLSSIPRRVAFGLGGAAGLGRVCGSRGRPNGLPARTIAQVDDMSGGYTSTSLPMLVASLPANDAIIRGSFRALAVTGFPHPHGGFTRAPEPVSLTISRGRRRVLRVFNAGRPGGARVRGLRAGIYTATWVISDRNGDTRTVVSRFEEQ
jgi:hypothetical protein